MMATLPKPAVRVWVIALIPLEGADYYDGVRVAAFLTEEDCYRDLAEWLEIDYVSNDQTKAALDRATYDEPNEEGYGIQAWKIEEQTIYA